MKKENKNQIVVSPLMGKSVESTHQFVIPRLMGNPAERKEQPVILGLDPRIQRQDIPCNKALNTAGCPIRSGMTECGEMGRSMVEMLGVLAVMGVLSVGGVAMYTTAMNKHRANELLNEASKRAAVLAMQITAGKVGPDLSIGEFTNPSGYIFGVDESYAAGGKTFKLTLKKEGGGNIDDTICAQMKAALGDNAAMAIDDTCTTLTFNADMSRGVDANAGNDGDNDALCTETPTGCQVCMNGELVDSDDECPTDSVCVDGMCTDTLTGDGCARNSDCEEGYFCNFNGHVNCIKGPTGKNGTCREATFEKTTVADDGIKGKLSTQTMDWFSAKNFCAAVGSSMISLKGSGIDKSKLGSYFEKNDYCHGSGSGKCEGVNWSVYKGNLASTYWWTKDLKSDSCRAFYVNASASGVYGATRDYSNKAALCK